MAFCSSFCITRERDEVSHSQACCYCNTNLEVEDTAAAAVVEGTVETEVGMEKHTAAAAAAAAAYRQVIYCLSPYSRTAVEAPTY